jgi:hypothetical protein
MKSVATIGLDIAKPVFYVHGVDAAGQVVVRQRLTAGGSAVQKLQKDLANGAPSTHDPNEANALILWFHGTFPAISSKDTRTRIQAPTDLRWVTGDPLGR